MPSSPSVLLLGHDEVLLYTRREILDRAGFEVRIASSLKDLEDISSIYHLDLVVICHSVSPGERANVSKVARELNPETYSLTMAEALPAYAGVLNASDLLSANTFLATVQRAIQSH